MRRLVDEIVLVTDDEILAAMAFLFDRLKLVTEPSGAIATAALLAGHVDAGGAPRRRDRQRRQRRPRALHVADGGRSRSRVAGSRRASSVRERTPSLRYARVRSASTVRSETNSSPAISRFDRPPAASSAIRSSLAVSSSRSAVRRPPTRAVSARARSAQPAAPSASNSRSACCQRLARRPSLPRPALARSRARARARASSNGPPNASARADRVGELAERDVGVALRGAHQPAAAPRHDAQPRPAAPASSSSSERARRRRLAERSAASIASGQHRDHSQLAARSRARAPRTASSAATPPRAGPSETSRQPERQAVLGLREAALRRAGRSQDPQWRAARAASALAELDERQAPRRTAAPIRSVTCPVCSEAVRPRRA